MDFGRLLSLLGPAQAKPRSGCPEPWWTVPKGLVLRRVGREAEDDVRDILHASFLTAYGDLVPEHRFGRMLAEDPLFGAFPHHAASDWRHLLAELDGQPVAFLQFGISMPSDHLLFIGRLYVHPEHQRRGIGCELLATTVDLAPDVRHVLLNIAAHFAPAAAFYRRHGFRPVGGGDGKAITIAPKPRPVFRVGDTVMGGHDPLDLPTVHLAAEAATIPRPRSGVVLS